MNIHGRDFCKQNVGGLSLLMHLPRMDSKLIIDLFLADPVQT